MLTDADDDDDDDDDHDDDDVYDDDDDVGDDDGDDRHARRRYHGLSWPTGRGRLGRCTAAVLCRPALGCRRRSRNRNPG